MRRLGREALVRESLTALAVDPRAPMLDLAKAIGVGRTTLYRHFGDRDALVSEVARYGARMFVDAIMSARPDEGTGLEAVERICAELFTLPDVLTLMFADNPIISDEVFAEVERERRAEGVEHSGEAREAGTTSAGEAEDPLEQIVVRGQADGSITTGIPVVWAAMHVFLTIGTGHLFTMTTGSTDPAGRARALELTIRAVRRTLGTASVWEASD